MGECGNDFFQVETKQKEHLISFAYKMIKGVATDARRTNEGMTERTNR